MFRLLIATIAELLEQILQERNVLAHKVEHGLVSYNIDESGRGIQ